MNNANINSNNLTKNQSIAMANIILALRETSVFGIELEWQFGYNEQSGNVWCWLEDYGITLVAKDYDPYRVTYYVTNFEDGTEYEYETFDEALEANEKINA